MIESILFYGIPTAFLAYVSVLATLDHIRANRSDPRPVSGGFRKVTDLRTGEVSRTYVRTTYRGRVVSMRPTYAECMKREYETGNPEILYPEI